MLCKIWTQRVGILTMERIWTRCRGRSETRFVTERSHYRLFKKRWLRSNIWHTSLLGKKKTNLGVRKILADLWLMIREGVRPGYIWYSGGVVRADDIQSGNCGSTRIICMERIHWETSSRSTSWDSSHFVELEVPSPYSQKPAICSYPERDETRLLHIIFLCDGQWTIVLQKREVCSVYGLIVLVSIVEVMFVKRLLHVTVSSEYVVVARLFVYRDFILE